MGSPESDLALGLDAADLVPGDVPGIVAIADSMRMIGSVLEEGGASLSRVEVTRWRGEAALRWEAAIAREPTRWHVSADAFSRASAALEAFADCFPPARDLAAVAHDLYQRSCRPLASPAVPVTTAPAGGVVSQAATVSANPITAMFAQDEEGKKHAVDLVAMARLMVANAGRTAAAELTAALADAPEARRFFESTIRPAGATEAGHVGLGALGMVPVVGFVPDLANALWYASEDRYVEAGLSAASAVPGPGDVIGAGVLAGSLAVRSARGLDGVDALLQGSREVALGRGVEPGLISSGDPGKLLTHVPYGFGSREAWESFSRQVNDALAEAGVTDAQVYLRGSSVTGFRYSTGESIAGSGPGDYDLAVASPELLTAAREARIYLRSGGKRTIALDPRSVAALGLADTVKSASALAGRKVSLMIYHDGDVILARGDAILVP